MIQRICLKIINFDLNAFIQIGSHKVLKVNLQNCVRFVFFLPENFLNCLNYIDLQNDYNPSLINLKMFIIARMNGTAYKKDKIL